MLDLHSLDFTITVTGSIFIPGKSLYILLDLPEVEMKSPIAQKNRGKIHKYAFLNEINLKIKIIPLRLG